MPVVKSILKLERTLADGHGRVYGYVTLGQGKGKSRGKGIVNGMHVVMPVPDGAVEVNTEPSTAPIEGTSISWFTNADRHTLVEVDAGVVVGSSPRIGVIGVTMEWDDDAIPPTAAGPSTGGGPSAGAGPPAGAPPGSAAP